MVNKFFKNVKKFFKSKKGKEMVEIIVLTPITVWLILFTTVRLLSYAISSQIQKEASTYMRDFITDTTFYSAVCQTYDDVAKSNLSEKTVITSITITDATTGEASVLEFSEDSSETTYFMNMFSKINGKTMFNYDVSTSFKASYNNMVSKFQRGNYVEITCQREINEFLSTLTNVTFYNPTTKKNVTLDFLTPGIIKASTKNIIIS